MLIHNTALDIYLIDSNDDGALDAITQNDLEALALAHDCPCDNTSPHTDLGQISPMLAWQYFGTSEGSLRGVSIKALDAYLTVISQTAEQSPTPETLKQAALLAQQAQLSPDMVPGMVREYWGVQKSAEFFCEPDQADQENIFNAKQRQQLKEQTAQLCEQIANDQGPWVNRAARLWNPAMGNRARNILLDDDTSPEGMRTYTGFSTGPIILSPEILCTIVTWEQTLQGCEHKMVTALQQQVSKALAEFYAHQIQASTTGSPVSPQFWQDLSAQILNLPQNTRQNLQTVYQDLTGTSLIQDILNNSPGFMRT